MGSRLTIDCEEEQDGDAARSILCPVLMSQLDGRSSTLSLVKELPSMSAGGDEQCEEAALPILC